MNSFVAITFSTRNYYIYNISISSHSILNFTPIYHLKHLQTGAGIKIIDIMDMLVDHKSFESYKNNIMLIEIYLWYNSPLMYLVKIEDGYRYKNS
jgi:hypothetical protein